MVIYKATNLKNGKVYIGQTVRPLRVRILEHARHHEILFDKAIQKYGLDNFTFEIIDTAKSIDELNDKEKHWIKQYNSYDKNGYNVCDGGGNTKGYHHREESKKKMSVAKKATYIGVGNPFYGKCHSEESRMKISESRTGRIITDEWKRHISEGSKQKRKVKNLETKEIFNSIVEAAKQYNIKPTHISKVCRGRQQTTGGYHWEYVS